VHGCESEGARERWSESETVNKSGREIQRESGRTSERESAKEHAPTPDRAGGRRGETNCQREIERERRVTERAREEGIKHSQ